MLGIAELLAACSTAKKAKSIQTTAFGAFLLLTFVVFPSVSTTVLRFYNCMDYEEGFADGSTKTIKVLEADHDISCESPSYKGFWTTYALAMLFVYPIGIPLLYWVQLFRYRKQLDPDVDVSRLSEIEDTSDGRARSPSAEAYHRLSARLPQRQRNSSTRKLMETMLGANQVSAAELQERKLKLREADDSIHHLLFLFEERAASVSCNQALCRSGSRVRYEPRCYQFVVFECFRKLALTGLLIFMYPGSASQIAIGLLIAVLSKEYYTHLRPYVKDADDALANVGNAQIILVFIASLMIFIKDMDEQDGAPGNMFKGPIFAGCMVVIGTLVLVVTIYMILVETCTIDPNKIPLLSPRSKKPMSPTTASPGFFSEPEPVAATDTIELSEPEIKPSPDQEYDQICHEIIHEAPDNAAELALPAEWRHAASLKRVRRSSSAPSLTT